MPSGSTQKKPCNALFVRAEPIRPDNLSDKGKIPDKEGAQYAHNQ